MSIIKRLVNMSIDIINKEEIKMEVSKREVVERLIEDYIWNKYKYKGTKRDKRSKLVHIRY